MNDKKRHEMAQLDLSYQDFSRDVVRSTAYQLIEYMNIHRINFDEDMGKEIMDYLGKSLGYEGF